MRGDRPAWFSLALTPADMDDGILTVIEIAGLRVPADLVILSAGETGLGLTSAFRTAGASRVLASLWRVEDRAARSLNVRFHELWRRQRIEPSRALRMAQAHIRAQARWRHPSHRAGWALWEG